ncbi:hypothetical protein ACT453_09635, partial [Bacillus sp. D-CC]
LLISLNMKHMGNYISLKGKQAIRNPAKTSQLIISGNSKRGLRIGDNGKTNKIDRIVICEKRIKIFFSIEKYIFSTFEVNSKFTPLSIIREVEIIIVIYGIGNSNQ